MNEFLGIDMDDVMAECNKLKEAHITFSCLQQIFHNNQNKALEFENRPGFEVVRDRHMSQCIRTYLLYIVGCTIFVDKSL